MSKWFDVKTGKSPVQPIARKSAAKYPFNFNFFALAPVVMLLLAAFYWGTGNVAQSVALVEISPLLLVGLRSALGFFFLLPFAIGECRRNSLDWKYFWRNRTCLMLPIVSFGAALALQTIGGAYTTATNVGFLVNMCVLMTPILLWILYRQKPSHYTLMACGLCLTGVAMLTGLNISKLNLGDAICMASALFYSLWVIGLERAQVNVDAPITVTALQFVLPALIGLSFGFDLENIDAIVSWPALPALIYLGVFSTGVGFLFATMALRHVGPMLSVMIYSLEAIFGAVAAFFILDERMQTIAIVGAGIMLASIIMIEVRESKKNELPQQR